MCEKFYVVWSRHLVLTDVEAAVPADRAVHRLVAMQTSHGGDYGQKRALAVIDPEAGGRAELEVRLPVEPGNRLLLLTREPTLLEGQLRLGLS